MKSMTRHVELELESGDRWVAEVSERPASFALKKEVRVPAG